MQSKTSLFNGYLISKGLKRYWPLWTLEAIIAAIVGFALISNIKSNMVNNITSAGYWERLNESYADNWYGLLDYMVPIIAIINAIVIAMVVWNYLYTAKSAYFFHSLPVKREAIFGSNFLVGYIMMNIPYAVGIIILAIGTAAFNIFSLKGMLVFTLGTLGENLFFFALATFIAHLSGHILGLPVLYLLANFLVILVEYMVDVISAGYLYGVRSSYNGVTEFMCPVVCIINNTSYSEGKFIGGIVILIYSLIGIALGVVSLLLYRKRKSETAGDVISVKILKPVLHISITLSGTLCGGFVIYLLFAGFYFTKLNPIGFAASLAVACIICYYVLLMLMEKSIKVFNKKTLIPMLVCLAVVISANAVMAMDLFNIETYIPDAATVKQVEVYIDGNNVFVDPVADKELYDRIVATHKTICENTEFMDGDIELVYDETEEDNNVYYSLSLTYELKNGSEVNRNYALYADFSDESNLDVCERAYLDLMQYPGLMVKLLHLNDEYKLTEIYCYVNNDYSNISIESGDAKKLYDAVVKDAEAGNWEPYNFNKIYKDDYTSVMLDMSFETAYYFDANSSRNYYDWCSVLVTEEMENTINILLEQDIISKERVKDLPSNN